VSKTSIRGGRELALSTVGASPAVFPASMPQQRAASGLPCLMRLTDTRRCQRSVCQMSRRFLAAFTGAERPKRATSASQIPLDTHTTSRCELGVSRVAA
jgi:hypothetical protein